MMSHSEMLGHIEHGASSIHSQVLLTPPLSPASSEDVPFRPERNDGSLTMKKRHKDYPSSQDRRRLNRACASSAELRPPIEVDHTGLYLIQNKSLPSLYVIDIAPSFKTLPTAPVQSSDHRDFGKRRWTLPSKSNATQGLASKVYAERKPAETKPASKNSPSPAMITLRRASTSKPISRKTSLTFFPPPRFERSRSGLLTAFLNTITGREDDYQTPTNTIKHDSRRGSTISVKDGTSDAARKASAPTVFTTVSGMEANLLQPSQQGSDQFVRRCSTKFISAGSVYEVIWDENVSSSGSASGSDTATGSRRRSTAMDKLETQLFKAVAQSRRESLAAQGKLINDAPPKRSSSLSSMLTPRLSRAARQGSSLTQRVTSLPLEAKIEEMGASEQLRKCSIEFFPPLRSRATTGSSRGPESAGVDFLGRHEADELSFSSLRLTRTEDEAPSNLRARMDGMKGSIRLSVGLGRRYSSVRRATDDESTTPLLDSLRMA
jgi:hypothetical protein